MLGQEETALYLAMGRVPSMLMVAAAGFDMSAHDAEVRRT